MVGHPDSSQRKDEYLRCARVPMYLNLAMQAALFLYMMFYYFLPEPVIFDQESVFSVFPNMRSELSYLESIGKGDVGYLLLNYQANIVFFIVAIVSFYFVFILIYAGLLRNSIFIEPSGKRYPDVDRLLMFSLGMGAFLCLHLYGIWPLTRDPSVDSRVDISDPLYLFFLWLIVALIGLFWTMSIAYLAHKIRRSLNRNQSL